MADPTPTPTADTPAPPAGWKVKSKFLGIGLLLGLLGGTGLAGKVYFDLSGTIDTLETSAATADSRDAALQARAAVASTETELESANFGNARKHLDVAKRKLSEVDREAGLLDVGILATITERLESVTISSDGANTAANTTLDEIGLALDRELIRSN